jgi:ribosomal protein L6P/L9E
MSAGQFPGVSVDRRDIAEANVSGAESTALGVFAAELKAQRQRLGWTQREVRLPYKASAGH